MPDEPTPEAMPLPGSIQHPGTVVRTAEELIAAYEQGIRDFSRSDLRGVNLQKIQTPSLILRSGSLKSVNLQEANLTGSIFINCDCNGSNL